MSVLLYDINKRLEQEKERIFLWFPVLFATGIWFYLSLDFEPAVWVTFVVLEGLIFWAYFWRHNMTGLSVLACLSVFVLGFANIQMRAYHLSKVPLLQKEELVYLRGYVDASGYNYRGKRYFILDKMQDFDGQKIVGKYRITPLQAAKNISVGDCVETVANMRPLMMPDMAEAYQFNRQQYFNGIKATGYTDVSITKIDCRDIGVHSGYFLPKIEAYREKIAQRIYQILPSQTAGIAAAVIAGERGLITPAQAEQYRDAGLAHFLAISGLHMGMIAGLMFFVVRWLLACFPTIALRYDTRKAAAVLAIIMSFIYLIISGWQISTQRAFIMTFLALSGILAGRRAISMRMVSWAALLILVLEPQVLISAGFQMSFAAVIMLIAFYEKYAAVLQRPKIESYKSSRFKRWLMLAMLYLLGVAVADLIASLATLPFVIYHFNRVSVYTSLANITAGPVIAFLIMPCVLLSLLLMPFGLEQYALYPAGKGIEIVNGITEYVSGLSYASVQIMSMPVWGLALIVFGGLWLALWQTSWRRWGIPFIVLGFLSVLTVKVPDLLTDNGANTFAMKDNGGSMVILPNRGNYFTKKMWSEKLASNFLSEEKKEKLRLIYKGEAEDNDWLKLHCNENSCLYKDKAILYKDGGLKIEDKDYSDVGALAVYNLENTPKINIVRQKLGQRYWNF